MLERPSLVELKKFKEESKKLKLKVPKEIAFETVQTETTPHDKARWGTTRIMLQETISLDDQKWWSKTLMSCKKMLTQKALFDIKEYSFCTWSHVCRIYIMYWAVQSTRFIRIIFMSKSVQNEEKGFKVPRNGDSRYIWYFISLKEEEWELEKNINTQHWRATRDFRET